MKGRFILGVLFGGAAVAVVALTLAGRPPTPDLSAAVEQPTAGIAAAPGTTGPPATPDTPPPAAGPAAADINASEERTGATAEPATETPGDGASDAGAPDTAPEERAGAAAERATRPARAGTSGAGAPETAPGERAGGTAGPAAGSARAGASGAEVPERLAAVEPTARAPAAGTTPSAGPAPAPQTPDDAAAAPATPAAEEAATGAGAPSFDVIRVDASGQTVIAGQARPNETVELLLDGEVIGTAETDASGRFATVVMIEFSGAPRQLQLRMPAEGAAQASAGAKGAGADERLAAAGYAAGAESATGGEQRTPAREAADAGSAAGGEQRTPAGGAADAASAGGGEKRPAAGEAADADRAAGGEQRAPAGEAPAAPGAVAGLAPAAPADRAGPAVAEGSGAPPVAGPRPGPAAPPPAGAAPAAPGREPGAATHSRAGELAALTEPGDTAPAGAGAAAPAPRGAPAPGRPVQPQAAGPPSAAPGDEELRLRPGAQAGGTGAAARPEPSALPAGAGSEVDVAMLAPAPADGRTGAVGGGAPGAAPSPGIPPARPSAPPAGDAQATTGAAPGPRQGAPSPGEETRYVLSAPVIILPAEGRDEAPALVQPRSDELAMIQPSGPGTGGVMLDKISYGAKGELSLRGRGSPRHAVRVYGNGRMLGTATVHDGTWDLSLPRQQAEGLQLLRFDEIGAGGQVTSRIEAPFEYTGTAPQVMRDREVIVQKGDNLWRIAEQHYGEGLRYSVIYSANSDLIRDPDLIYPDQVFTIPELVDAE